MSQRQAYQRPDREMLFARLKKEWVELDGGPVCVWEMNAAEMLALGQRSARPSIDQRGGVDATTASILLVAFCTHTGDDIDSPRLWDEARLGEIQLLRGEEFAELSEAIQRVNGTGKEAGEAMRDFTPATEEPNTSASSSSVSSNSAASPQNSKRSLTPR